jgi:hypothetical protein
MALDQDLAFERRLWAMGQLKQDGWNQDPAWQELKRECTFAGPGLPVSIREHEALAARDPAAYRKVLAALDRQYVAQHPDRMPHVLEHAGQLSPRFVSVALEEWSRTEQYATWLIEVVIDPVLRRNRRWLGKLRRTLGEEWLLELRHEVYEQMVKRRLSVTSHFVLDDVVPYLRAVVKDVVVDVVARVTRQQRSGEPTEDVVLDEMVATLAAAERLESEAPYLARLEETADIDQRLTDATRRAALWPALSQRQQVVYEGLATGESFASLGTRLGCRPKTIQREWVKIREVGRHIAVV